jgi:rhamnosyltransferase subunit B
MHAILVSLGTDGDVIPYVGLGARLRSRGHRVTLVANERFRAPAAGQGLGFRALVSDEEFDELLANPDFWHPIRGGPLAARWGARLLGRQYALLAEFAGDGDVVLASSPGVFAPRLVQETLGTPLATIMLQPGLIPSVSAPPVMPSFPLPRRAPRPFGALYWRLIDALGGLLIGRHLNRLRSSLGLGPVRRVFRWWYSPERVIGLFPEWYGPPQDDWPPQTRLAGFPLFDGASGGGLPPDLREFCRAGDPPIAFTFGTGMLHAEGLFRAALDACRELGARGIFLTRHARQLPAPLPPTVRHCEFAPFRELFPHCGAVVHHGGVGTAAKALATGTPQLILPLAWDQMDNAARVKRLGAGDWLKSKRVRGAQIAEALARLLTPEVRSRCRAVAARFGPDDALEVAARMVEELAEGSPSSTPSRPGQRPRQGLGSGPPP